MKIICLIITVVLKRHSALTLQINSMPYSVKVNFGQNLSIEVFGDEIGIVTQLLNETTRKFFPDLPASKVEI